MSNPRRPEHIPVNAWRVMQFLRNGNDLCIPCEGSPWAGTCDMPAAAVDFLLSNGFLVRTQQYSWASFYRMTDAAWDVAAGDAVTP